MWSVCSARSKELIALLHKVTCTQLGIESEPYARTRPRPDSGLYGAEGLAKLQVHRS